MTDVGDAVVLPTDASDLAVLLERAGHGDEVAFAAVFDLTSARTFGLACEVLGDPALAEETTQETYLHLWLHSARYDPARGSAIAWVLMIAHARAVSRVRSTEARRRREAPS